MIPGIESIGIATALTVGKKIAKKAIEAIAGDIGSTAAEAAKKVIDRYVEKDREAAELAREELKAWESAFGALSPRAHPAAQILRASVRPFLTAFVTIVVAVGMLKGIIPPDHVTKAWYVIVGAWFGERIFRHYALKRD